MICTQCGSYCNHTMGGKCQDCEPRLKESNERSRALDNKRHDLVWAMRTRLLTAEEMKQVHRWGVDLLIDTGVSYLTADKEREFNDLLWQQFRFRTITDGGAA